MAWVAQGMAWVFYATDIEQILCEDTRRRGALGGGRTTHHSIKLPTHWSHDHETSDFLTHMYRHCNSLLCLAHALYFVER